VSRRTGALAAALLLLFAAPAAHAVLGSPDESWRQAQLDLRDAARDTLSRPGDPATFDALGDALFRMARLPEARRAYGRAAELAPADARALAGLGRIALFRSRDDEAESLLVRAGTAEGAAHDLYVLALRRHDWTTAAAHAEEQDEAGRREMLERLAQLGPPAAPAGPDHVTLLFSRAFPVPLVQVTLGGQRVLMAVDPGAPELLLDPAAARNAHAEIVPGERSLAWNGVSVGARNAIVHRLELGAYVLTDVPAAVTPLHAYSNQVNPQEAQIAGVIGLPVLERFGVTLDFHAQELVLRRPGEAVTAVGARVPFERWGESDLVVYGSIAGGRRMAFSIGTGLPDAGIGAPRETFDEVGLQGGRIANFIHAASGWSQVTVPTISVGPIVAEHVAGWSGAMGTSELWRLGPRHDGLLGPQFFARRKVTFDWAKGELVFEDE